MVIESHPRLDDGSPFPTLYWLTCPILLKRVSRLESEGFMNELNDRLGREQDMRGRLTASIERMIARRDSHEVLDDPGSPPGGGPDKVKCLHAHVAIELVQNDDPAGSIALALSGWPDCRLPCVEPD
jgi:uncharacterized protein